MTIKAEYAEKVTGFNPSKWIDRLLEIVDKSSFNSVQKKIIEKHFLTVINELEKL